uniref:Uncharacterized protein n=1 Tax=Anguilla anguilla TaxID=7936 RepID=A0A0E9QZI1_ANGAN
MPSVMPCQTHDGSERINVSDVTRILCKRGLGLTAGGVPNPTLHFCFCKKIQILKSFLCQILYEPNLTVLSTDCLELLRS